MAAPPPSKRRRLIAAQSTLTKPFRSPLITNPQSQRTTHSQTPAESQAADEPESQTSKPNGGHQPRTALQTTTNQTHQAKIKELESQISTLTHALALASSSKDVELKELTRKWRATSRLAAEEVFTVVHDRVMRMGGVSAWEEREAEKREMFASWDKAPQGEGSEGEDSESASEDDDDDGDDEERAMRRERRDARREERERRREERAWRREELEMEADRDGGEDAAQGRGVGNAAMEVKDGDGFTMGMMLRTLNIDPVSIGFDAEGQRWIEEDEREDD